MVLLSKKYIFIHFTSLAYGYETQMLNVTFVIKCPLPVCLGHFIYIHGYPSFRQAKFVLGWKIFEWTGGNLRS